MITISKDVIGIYSGGLRSYARGGRIAAGGGLFAGGPFAAGLIAGGLFASEVNAAPRPGHWPDHIGLQNSNIIIVYTFYCDCLISCYVHNHMYFQCLGEV